MPVYSERFIATNDPNATTQYVVPYGKRAVIRCVTATSGSSLQQYSNVMVAGHYLFFLSFPAPGSLVNGDLRVVVYGGEAIEVLHQGTILWTTVSGYLFDDVESVEPAAAAMAQQQSEDPWLIAHVPPAGF